MKILIIQLFAVISVLGTQVSGYPQERLMPGECLCFQFEIKNILQTLFFNSYSIRLGTPLSPFKKLVAVIMFNFLS